MSSPPRRSLLIPFVLVFACSVLAPLAYGHTLAAAPRANATSINGGQSVLPLAEIAADESWSTWLKKLATCVVLCAAASPAPYVLPLAIMTGFQTTAVQQGWTMLFDNLTPYQICTYGFAGTFVVVYWVAGLMLLVVDSYIRPDVIKQFKIQKSARFDTAKLGKVCRNLLLNQFAIVLPVSMFYGSLAQAGVCFTVSRVLPPPGECALHFVGYILINEVVFYYGHWLFHANKWLYKKVHKQHHEFQSPIALTAAYCHPVEMLVSNVLPLSLGGLIMGSHIFTLLAWVVFAALGTQYHHCGYKFPWSPWFDEHPNFHDFHHEVFNSNYGAIGWLDNLHGTSIKWHVRVAKEQEEKAKAHAEKETKRREAKAASGPISSSSTRLSCDWQSVKEFRIHTWGVVGLCVIWLTVSVVSGGYYA